MSFEKVFTQGTLIDINIRVWRAQIILRAEEIGLSDKDIPAHYDLGKKLLIPAEIIKEFTSLESKARQLLIRNSYTFAFGSARFVPKKCLMDFINQFDKLKDEFNKLKENFISKYDIHRNDMRPHFKEAAEISYNNAISMLMRNNKELGMTKEEYINNYLENIEENYPTPEELVNKFKMEYDVFQVALPDLTQVTYDDITEQDSKIRLLENTQKKQLLRKVNNFFTESIMEIRSKVITALDRFENAINGKYSSVAFSRMKDALDTYEKMCFFDDHYFMKSVNLFREKVLDIYNSDLVWRNNTIKKIVLENINRFREKAQDKNSIKEITQKFREKMDI